MCDKNEGKYRREEAKTPVICPEVAEGRKTAVTSLMIVKVTEKKTHNTFENSSGSINEKTKNARGPQYQHNI